MEARCIDDSPGIDCMRACHAAFRVDPRAAVNAVLRGALALASVDTDTAKAAGEAPRLLLQPTHALPKPLRHVEWPLAFQYNTIVPGPLFWWDYLVQLTVKTDSRSNNTNMIMHVILNPLSEDVPWWVESIVTTNEYQMKSKRNGYASWEEVADVAWDGIAMMASTLPKETLLKMSVSFRGKAYVKYDLGASDLDVWTSVVSALFRPFPPSEMAARVRTFDARHGVLTLDGIDSTDTLKAWAAHMFAKARTQAPSHVSPGTSVAMNCTLRFDLPYSLRVADAFR
jgi:hypothetical protein